MDSRQRWRRGFIASVFFHTAVFCCAAFLGAGSGSVQLLPEPVEVELAEYGGGGGGGGGGGQRPQVIEVDDSELETLTEQNSAAKAAAAISETVKDAAVSKQAGDSLSNISETAKDAAAGQQTQQTGNSPIKVPRGTDLSGPNTGTGGGYGTGTGSGIGSGSGPGTGSGSGGGHGSGQGTGIGSGIGAGRGSVTPPRLLNDPKPDYPEDARQQGLQGSVVVRILVQADGSVGGVSVQSSSGVAAFDQAALRAAGAARFVPARNSSGVPVASYTRRSYSFGLR